MKLKKYVVDYLNTTIATIYLQQLLNDYTKYLQSNYTTDLPNNTQRVIMQYIKEELKRDIE